MNQQMKVLHVIPSVSETSGGPSQAIFPMCRALRDHGIEVVLATTDHELGVSSSNFQASGSQSAIRHFNDVPTIFFPAQAGSSFKYSRPFSAWLNDNVSQFDVVHIHAVFNHACIAAARACRENKVPYIVRPLGTLDPWSMKQKPLRKRVFWHAGIKKILSAAAAIHYTTRAEQQSVETSLGLNHGAVVPLGIEMQSTEPARAQEQFSEHFPELCGQPYVLVLSRLHPKKGLEVLVDAFLSLMQQPEFQAVRLVLAGEGEASYVQMLKRKVENRHAAQSILFPGWLSGEKKDAVLRNASLLALPSHQENFGVCVIESLTCGVPVLISPHVNLAEQIETAGAGWVAEIDEVKLKTAMAEALGSKSERERRGRAGQDLAKNFTWPLVATQLNELYQSVVKTPAQVATV
jgi:glycosyltransferase involved in cell wall biosynthesis